MQYNVFMAVCFCFRCSTNHAHLITFALQVLRSQMGISYYEPNQSIYGVRVLIYFLPLCKCSLSQETTIQRRKIFPSTRHIVVTTVNSFTDSLCSVSRSSRSHVGIYWEIRASLWYRSAKCARSVIINIFIGGKSKKISSDCKSLSFFGDSSHCMDNSHCRNTFFSQYCCWKINFQVGITNKIK